MWGWRTVEKEVRPGVPMDDARRILAEAGFDEQSGDESHAVMKKDGTQITKDGSSYPIELAVAEADGGLMLHLRYDRFVLFDTGDLVRYGEEIAGWLEPAKV